VNGYGAMIVLGFLLTTWLAAREARRRGLPDFAYDLGMVMLLCGIVGGRVFYCVQFHDSPQFAGKPFWSYFAIWEGGLVFYGGAAGGLLGGLFFVWRKQLPLADTVDIVAMTSPIGMAFGRVGCFLHGCCFGRLCSADAAPALTQFPQGSPAHQHQVESGWIALTDPSLKVHPIQLYQGIHDALLFVILWYYLRRASTPRGSGLPLLLVLYGIGRFFLEGLRGDHGVATDELTVSQWVSIGAITVGLATLILVYTRFLRGRVVAAKISQKSG